jgi:transcriptional regulator with XRE-family HTH domain
MGSAVASRSGIHDAVLAPRLLTLRLEAALSQEELAARARVSRMTIVRAEQGKPVRLSSVRKIARALRVRPRDLMGDLPA